MTQAIDDLLTLFKTFNHTTVNTAITSGGGTEQLSDDPTILLERDYLDLAGAADTNGYVILTDEQEGASIELGAFRHIPYFIGGYIYYESRTDKTSLVINSIKDQLRHLMNVNNNKVSSTRTYVYTFSPPVIYNNAYNPGIITFNVKAVKTDVDATA
jgi:hypothetical protein